MSDIIIIIISINGAFFLFRIILYKLPANNQTIVFVFVLSWKIKRSTLEKRKKSSRAGWRTCLNFLVYRYMYFFHIQSELLLVYE